MTPNTFQIPLALADGGKHGYGIIREVEGRTNGTLRLGPGTLYAALQRMMEDGLVEETTGESSAPGEDRRRYYRLTKEGRSAAREEAVRLRDLVSAAQAKRLIRDVG